MKNLKDSQEDILPINWYWPKDSQDFSRLSDKIVENTTTLDNDKKIAENTEKLVADAKKRMNGKTAVGRLVTAEDFEKLLSPSVEDQTIESAFGTKNGNRRKYNAAMQIALSGRMLSLQKGIARAGVPDHFVFVEDEDEISDNSLRKSRRTRTASPRNMYNLSPDNSLDVFNRRDLGIIPRIVPYWGGKLIENREIYLPGSSDQTVGDATKLTYGRLKSNTKGDRAANALKEAGWHTVQNVANLAMFAGLYMTDLLNHGLAGVLGSKSGPIPIGTLIDVLSGKGRRASLIMGAQNKDGEQTGLGGNAPTAEILDQYDAQMITNPANNMRESRMMLRAQKNHMDEFTNKIENDYREHISDLVDTARMSYGKHLKDARGYKGNDWDDAVSQLFEARQRWQERNNQPWEGHTFAGWDVNHAQESEYKKNLVDVQVEKAKQEWKKQFDVNRKGLKTLSGLRIADKKFFVNAKGQRYASVSPAAKGFAKKITNEFHNTEGGKPTVMNATETIINDPVWKNAYEHQFGTSYTHSL